MRRDKAVLDDKGVLRRGPRGARVWVEIYPLKPAQAQASRATFPTHWDRKGSETVVYHRLVEIDAAAAGCPQHRMDSPAAGRAWPLSRRPGPDARSITAIGPPTGTAL